MSEFASGYAQARKGDTRWLRWLVEDALSLHPNYVCLLGWQHHEALAFLREQPELVAHGLRTMGYRLVPLAVRHPARVRSGTPFAIGSDWLNRGVGRCLQDLRLVWILASADGAVTARLDGGATGAQAWVAGTPATIDSRLTSRGVVPGPHRLRVALHAPDGRAIALPLPGRAEDGSYALDAVIDILP
jgi:hypothetical protein